MAANKREREREREREEKGRRATLFLLHTSINPKPTPLLSPPQ
jgi:hypothetical protein